MRSCTKPFTALPISLDRVFFASSLAAASASFASSSSVSSSWTSSSIAGSVSFVFAATFSMAASTSPSEMAAMLLRPTILTATPTPTPTLELVVLALAFTLAVVPLREVTASSPADFTSTPLRISELETLFCTFTATAPATATEPSLVSAFWRFSEDALMISSWETLSEPFFPASFDAAPSRPSA